LVAIGQPLVSGTFVGAHPVSGPDTYGFAVDGAYTETCNLAWCRGNWRVEADGTLVSVFIQELDLLGPQGQILFVFVQRTRLYEAAFTVEDGQVLLLGALRKTSDATLAVPGTYEGVSTVETIDNNGTNTWTRHHVVTYLADGTWRSRTATEDTSLPQEEILEDAGTWTSGDVQLATYMAAVFLYDPDGGESWMRQ